MDWGGVGFSEQLPNPRPSSGLGSEPTSCPVLPGAERAEAELWPSLGTSGQHKLFSSPGIGVTAQPRERPLIKGQEARDGGWGMAVGLGS